MSGTTLALTVFLFLGVALTLAAPSKPRISGQVEESIYPLGRTRPVSSRGRGGGSSSGGNNNGGGGPILVFREREGRSYHNGRHPIVVPRQPLIWQRYRVIQDPSGGPRPREDEDSEEEDDYQDDESGSEEEQDELDTPSWDYLFPAEETGGHNGVSYRKGHRSAPGVVRVRQPVQGVYTIAQGSPGSQSFRGRSEGGSGSWSWPGSWWGRRQGQPVSEVEVQGPHQTPVVLRASKSHKPQIHYYDDDDVQGPSRRPTRPRPQRQHRGPYYPAPNRRQYPYGDEDYERYGPPRKNGGRPHHGGGGGGPPSGYHHGGDDDIQHDEPQPQSSSTSDKSREPIVFDISNWMPRFPSFGGGSSRPKPQEQPSGSQPSGWGGWLG